MIIKVALCILLSGIGITFVTAGVLFFLDALELL